MFSSHASIITHPLLAQVPYTFYVNDTEIMDSLEQTVSELGKSRRAGDSCRPSVPQSEAKCSSRPWVSCAVKTSPSWDLHPRLL